MFVAFDQNNNKISVDEAKSGDNYYCPLCNGKLKIKNGRIKTKHFAHISLNDCDNFSNDMSEWHKEWQKQFHINNREVVVTLEHEKHRADVLVGDYVIEFQHSPITGEEFNKRNAFYRAVGYKVIWVFDFIKEYNEGKIRCCRKWIDNCEKRGEYRWQYPKKFMRDYLPSRDKDIIVFFQIESADFLSDSENHYIERVIWSVEKLGMSNFSIFEMSNYPGNKTELINCIKNKIL